MSLTPPAARRGPRPESPHASRSTGAELRAWRSTGQRIATGRSDEAMWLALVVLHQHEAAKIRAEMSLDLLWQRRDDGLAVRRHPALAAVADRMHRHHEFLHQVGLVALEARSGRAVAFNTRSSTLTRGLTLPRRGLFPGRVGPAGVVAFSMPLGLISGRPFNPFSRAISSRCCATVCLSSATSPNSRTTSSFG